MNLSVETACFSVPSDENSSLANLCGPIDQNLRKIEQVLDVVIMRRGHQMQLSGADAALAKQLLEIFYYQAKNPLSTDQIELGVYEALNLEKQKALKNVTYSLTQALNADDAPKLYTRQQHLKGRTVMQREYVRQILAHDITFGIGPAGTGKTYLAVACAVDAFERGLVERIVLTRPAVEAGERLGFLPGDLSQKIDPYLRPLFDALYELLGTAQTQKLLERQVIDIAPLAYMRGRTLNRAFVILDEAQNTTSLQMKMLLTRLGFGSKAVITGDLSQIDLPAQQKSGLLEAQHVLHAVPGIKMVLFSAQDVVRHPLVARIIEAYAEYS